MVSVAGCLGYDVLENPSSSLSCSHLVSVAGCLGYDVLVAHKFREP
ncbi:hypothetical protein BCLUESOX_2356 [bacterium endosymbiont of Bathymodiolus sp. 5 South]|nr:hypothetical protein BCLUESOX_2356 [bacterium endosymbiont of Bathymodiolus sp. 5 South]VVH56195.1 hypothetical protein BSPCLSOX_2458 [uncultured Gammaproteobacteria bacterium]